MEERHGQVVVRSCLTWDSSQHNHRHGDHQHTAREMVQVPQRRRFAGRVFVQQRNGTIPTKGRLLDRQPFALFQSKRKRRFTLGCVSCEGNHRVLV